MQQIRFLSYLIIHCKAILLHYFTETLYMKRFIACFGVTLIAITSCKKESSSLNQTRLVQIKDSLNVYKLEYNNNNEVTALLIDSIGWWGHYTDTADSPIASYTYGFNYIKATMPWGFTEYYFNKNGFPLNIFINEHIGGVPQLLYETHFYYKVNSDLLDSAVVKTNLPLGVSREVYIPQYTNNNITAYTQTMIYPGSSYTTTYSFNYNNTPNVFRAGSPYLFVFTGLDPYFLPRIFSEKTLSSITAYGMTQNIGLQTNADGKLVYEDWGTLLPYKRVYAYQ
jgi:hypothetical protein